MSSEAECSIAKYIQNEKDISRYKISILEKNKNSTPSQKRILSIEREFVNLPLEAISFEDVADVAAAISIYRTSRSQFFDTYKISSVVDAEKDITNLLESKIKFLKKMALDYKTTKPQEINFVQNGDLYFDLIKRQSIKNKNSFEIEKKFLDSKQLKDLLKIEPSIIAKKRARAQAAIYSIGEYIQTRLTEIKDLNLEDPIRINSELDALVSSLNENIFSHYNSAASKVSSVIKNTMGENDYSSKIYELQNVLDFSAMNNSNFASPISNHKSFSKDAPMVGNLLFGQKKTICLSTSKDAERNIQNKVFGILLPIPRESNEKMTMLYKKIVVDDLDISELFCNTFSNVKATNESGSVYYKALLMHPLWKLFYISLKNKIYRPIICSLTGLDLDRFEDYDFEDQDFITKINDNNYGFINISNCSRILTTKTRSEDEGILEIFSIINSKLLEIKEEYNLLSDRG